MINFIEEATKEAFARYPHVDGDISSLTHTKYLRFIEGAQFVERLALIKIEEQDKDIVKVNEAYNGLWGAYNDWKLNSERLKSELAIAEKKIEEAKWLFKNVVQTNNNTPSEAEEINAFINK